VTIIEPFFYGDDWRGQIWHCDENVHSQRLERFEHLEHDRSFERLDEVQRLNGLNNLNAK
jgi:hypothetical protein